MKSYDFVIIGGGIAGVSAAAILSDRARVLLVEREQMLAYHTTGRSAALFTATYGPPLIRALTNASRAFFDQPPSNFASSRVLRDRGVLWLANIGREHRLADMAADHGGEIGHLASVAECAERVPILRRDHIAGGYVEYGAMDIDVDAVHQGFVRIARARGGHFATGIPELNLERRGSGWSLSIGGERVGAPVLINAAGAWSDQIAVSMGAAPMALRPLRRTALLVDPPAEVDVSRWPAVLDIDDEYYFKPDAGKLLLSPADETPSEPCDARPEEIDIAIAVDRVQQVADLPIRRVNHAWAGLRTFGPDGLPVVGFDPVVEGLFWLAGQGGYGIQTAPALAAIAASLATNDKLPEEVASLEIDIEALKPMTSRMHVIKAKSH